MLATTFLLIFGILAELMSTTPLLEHRCDSIKILIAGDSISQGYNADFTWRYRIWQWFQSNNVAMEFVGPLTGTRDQTTSIAPSDGTILAGGLYAEGVDPCFTADSSHYSIWGRAAAQTKGDIQGLVAQYLPDYILVALGFNDIGWFISDEAGTLKSMKELVDNARAAKSNIKLAIANIPQRTYLGSINAQLSNKTTHYNNMLANAIPEWSTTLSPIALVDFAGNYDCGIDSCKAGHDGLHPNILGEFQIAQSFSRTLLNSFGLGKEILEIPSPLPTRPCKTPEHCTLSKWTSGIVGSWNHTFGAYGYYADTRLSGSATWTGTQSVEANQVEIGNSHQGDRWEMRVNASCGDDPNGNSLFSEPTDVLWAVA